MYREKESNSAGHNNRTSFLVEKKKKQSKMENTRYTNVK